MKRGPSARHNKILCRPGTRSARRPEEGKADGLAYVILDGKIFSADRCGEKTTSVKGRGSRAYLGSRAG